MKTELGVKTPFDAAKKYPEIIENEIFKEKPLQFKNKILYLRHLTNFK